MDRVTLYIFVFCLAGIGAVQVRVSQGWLEGEELQTISDGTAYYSFKGIPYARPPVGKLRFMAPVPVCPWSGVRNATEHGPTCPQYDIFTSQLIPGDEDCLYLNVYTSDINTTLPVLFYIHGGGFKSGSGNVASYGPDFLIDKNVVVVTINYRLDILGYMCLNTAKVPGNAGMKDQVAALKWVQENIKYFGGDPSNVTIMGQSAGGVSVALHLISPMSKGLFNRAISMSGVPNCDFSIAYYASTRPYILAKMLGNDTKDPDLLVEFLQTVPVMDLVNAEVALSSEEVLASGNLLKSYYFTPVVEQDFGGEHFVLQEPLDAIRNGSVHEADVLFGNTNEESLTVVSYFESTLLSLAERYPEIIVPRKIVDSCTFDTIFNVSNATRSYYFGDQAISNKTTRAFVTYATEACITVPVHRYYTLFPKIGNSKIYSYKFSSFSSRNYYGSGGVPYGIYGAAHLDDCLYLFDAKSLNNMTIDRNSSEYRMVNLTTTLFTNFAIYGNPTPEPVVGVTWPEFDSTNKSYVNIANETLIVGEDAYGDAVDFWQTMFDYAGVDF